MFSAFVELRVLCYIFLQIADDQAKMGGGYETKFTWDYILFTKLTKKYINHNDPNVKQICLILKAKVIVIILPV